MLGFSFGTAMAGVLSLGGVFLLTTGFFFSMGALSTYDTRTKAVAPYVLVRLLLLCLAP